jgi:hypothetical protein
MGWMIFGIASFVVAVVATLLAVSVIRESRRQSAARVARLAADIHEWEPSMVHSVSADPAAGSMFDSAFAESRRPHAFGAVLAGALLVGGALALGVVLSGRSGTSRTSVVQPAAGAPLELVALQHEREGEQLTIRGTVRNPGTGTGVDRLSAVVLLFGPDGGLINTERADVSGGALAPGSQGSFVVTVPNAGNVGRYRVSFRTDDRVVPHVDRRS